MAGHAAVNRRLESYGPAGLLEVVFLHVIAEGPEAHTQQFGGLDLDPVRTPERFRDVFALEVLDVLFEVEALLGEGSGGRAPAPERQLQDPLPPPPPPPPHPLPHPLPPT